MKVAIIKTSGYENLREAIEKTLELTNFKIENKPLLVKPNLLAISEIKNATVTHPEFIKTSLGILKNHSDSIILGDSTGEQSYEGTEKVMQHYGLYDLADKKVKVENFDKEFEWAEINNKYFKKVMVSRILRDRQIIPLPKLKTHVYATYTGAVKNLYGCLYRAQKQIVHAKIKQREDFDAFLLDLYKYFKPRYVLMDAIDMMEGNGPSTGEVKRLNLVLGSEDALALDYVALKIVGIEPEKMPFIRQAIEQKLLKPEEIEVVGEKIEDVKTNIKMPTTFSERIMFGDFIFKLKIDKNKCIKCGKCARNCPTKAIKLKPYPIIDYKKCIKCFCCNEHCPEKAVEVVRARSSMNKVRKLAARILRKTRLIKPVLKILSQIQNESSNNKNKRI